MQNSSFHSNIDKMTIDLLFITNNRLVARVNMCASRFENKILNTLTLYRLKCFSFAYCCPFILALFRLFVFLFSWCPIYRTVNVKALTEDNMFTRKELIVTDLGRVRTLHIQIKILRLAWVRFAATGLPGLNLSLHGTLCPSTGLLSRNKCL